MTDLEIDIFEYLLYWGAVECIAASVILIWRDWQAGKIGL